MKTLNYPSNWMKKNYKRNNLELFIIWACHSNQVKNGICIKYSTKKINGQNILTFFLIRKDGIHDFHIKSLKHSLLLIFFNLVKPTSYAYSFCSKFIHKKLKLKITHNLFYFFYCELIYIWIHLTINLSHFKYNHNYNTYEIYNRIIS